MMPETSKPLADADGPEEFEKLYKERQKSPQPESEPQPEAEADLEVEVEAPETSEPSETPESETEPVSETGEPQEPKKRERSFQGRISELTGKVKAEKDRNDLLEQELRELRTRKPAIEQQAVAAPPAAQPKLDQDQRPKEDDPKYQVEDGFSLLVEDRAIWRLEQKQREAAQTRQQAEAQVIQAKVTSARKQHLDFDAIALSLNLSPSMFDFFKESDAGTDVVYHLGKNPEEYKRIHALSPKRQLAELDKIEASLSAPEKPKPQLVSRAAAPPRPLAGTEAATPKDLSQIEDPDEFERAYKARNRGSNHRH